MCFKLKVYCVFNSNEQGQMRRFLLEFRLYLYKVKTFIRHKFFKKHI